MSYGTDDLQWDLTGVWAMQGSIGVMTLRFELPFSFFLFLYLHMCLSLLLSVELGVLV